MKNTRRIAAFVASVLAVALMAAPMTSFAATSGQITITGVSTEQAHKFEVYQILTGELSGTVGADGNVLSNAKWGSGITSWNSTAVTEGDAVSADIMKTITDANDARDLLDLITLGTAATSVESASGTATVTGLADGWYVIKDVTNLDGMDDANSAWIIQVSGAEEIEIKNAKPSVDKQVLDELADAEAGSTDGWGESADHAINETFQFKLTATIPADVDFDAYDTYKVVFNDSMSEGVVFDSIASVLVGNTAIEDYTTAGTDTSDWTLTIDDVKSYGVNLANGVTITVVYNAHLNEEAIVDDVSRTGGDKNDTNCNTVYLQYSNNPDATGAGTSGLGQTEEDTVWVFTYRVDNTKYAESETGDVLPGAGFKLYSDADCTTEVPVIWSDTLGAYRLTTGDETGVEMVSADDGTFNIVGLDTGTYYLKETSTPTGYNTCAIVTVMVDADHAEQSDGTVNLDMESSSNIDNSIVNKSGSSLPSTGGIGTTIFVVGGGAMVAAAGILLVSKKRMSK